MNINKKVCVFLLPHYGISEKFLSTTKPIYSYSITFCTVCTVSNRTWNSGLQTSNNNVRLTSQNRVSASHDCVILNSLIPEALLTKV